MSRFLRTDREEYNSQETSETPENPSSIKKAAPFETASCFLGAFGLVTVVLFVLFLFVFFLLGLQYGMLAVLIAVSDFLSL